MKTDVMMQHGREEQKELRNKVLIYLASGPYHQRYETLPYDKIILVDRSSSFRRYTAPIGSKVEFWQMDALEAAEELIKRNIMVDCLVSVNEGLCEGGGSYPIFSDALLGYLYPCLADDLLVICDVGYYQNTTRMGGREGKMDWGFSIVRKFQEGDEEYIDPQFFMGDGNASRAVGKGLVCKLRRDRQEITQTIGKLRVKLIHGSIWNNTKELDAIGLNLNMPGTDAQNNEVSRFFFSKENVFCIQGMTMNDILNYCIVNGIKKIGLMPWMNGVYNDVYESLQAYGGDHDVEVSFYHLNHKDYYQLYVHFADYYLQKYPSLFSCAERAEVLRSELEEVLRSGHGEKLAALCDRIISGKLGCRDLTITQIKMKLGILRIYGWVIRKGGKRFFSVTEEVLIDNPL